MRKITSAELDEAVDTYLLADHVDADVLQREMNDVVEAINGSKRCQAALQGSVMHIIAKGPDHVSCAVTNTVAGFFVVALKLAMQRHKADTEINELENIFKLGDVPEA